MEMNDQVLQHIMNVQTQMLHQMMLQSQKNDNNISQQPSIATTTAPLSGPSLSPNTSALVNGIGQPGIQTTPTTQTLQTMPTMSVKDPTNYGTYAPPDLDNGSRPNQNQHSFFREGLISGSIAELMSFDPSRMSKEGTEQYLASQARGLQEQAMNITTGALGGAVTAGSFFIPGGLIASLGLGLGAGALVGGATHAMTQGAKNALDYQEILQEKGYKFINAFESSSDMGGIGIGLQDRQELSGFLRDLSVDKYLDDKDMMKILEGAADNNLLKTVNDVKSFKKKFTEIVDVVKEISVTMNQTVEEATKFMGEMESRGIATKDMSYLASQAKVMSSFLGIDADKGAQIIMQTSDEVVQGTSLDATKIMQSSAETNFYVEQLSDEAKKNDERLYHYIKNQGGAKQLGPSFEMTARDYIRNAGSDFLIGHFASAFEWDGERFQVNQQELDDLLNNEYSQDELQRRANDARSQLSTTQQYRLSQEIGLLFSDNADSRRIAQFINREVESIIEDQAKNGNILDRETVLQTVMQVAQDPDQAYFMDEMIQNLSDDELAPFYNARVLKEELDSHAISNNPSIKKEIQFWMKRNVTNPLGDFGQSISDAAGTGMEDLQKWMNGLDDRGPAGGSQSFNYTQEGLDNLVKETQKSLELPNLELKNTTKNDEITQDEVDLYISQYRKGQLSAADLADIDRRADTFAEQMRVDVLLGTAKGSYEGMEGKWQYFVDKTWAGITNLGDSLLNFGGSEAEAAAQRMGGLTFDTLEKQKKDIIGEGKKLQNEIVNLFVDKKLDLSKNELNELEEAIKEGDIDAVKALTGDKDALELAKRYQKWEKNNNKIDETKDDFKELSQYTAGMASAGTTIGDLLNASGLYDESEIDSLVGDLRKKGKDLRKDIKKGKVTAAEMFEFNQETLEDVEGILDTMSKKKKKELAQFLDERDDSIQIDAFYKEGSESIDTEKLQTYLLDNVIRNAQIKDIEKGSGTKEIDGKVVKDATDEHLYAMYQFLTTYQQESQMLRDAVNGVRVTQSNQTSLANRQTTG